MPPRLCSCPLGPREDVLALGTFGLPAFCPFPATFENPRHAMQCRTFAIDEQVTQSGREYIRFCFRNLFDSEFILSICTHHLLNLHLPRDSMYFFFRATATDGSHVVNNNGSSCACRLQERRLFKLQCLELVDNVYSLLFLVGEEICVQ